MAGRELTACSCLKVTSVAMCTHMQTVRVFFFLWVLFCCGCAAARFFCCGRRAPTKKKKKTRVPYADLHIEHPHKQTKKQTSNPIRCLCLVSPWILCVASNSVQLLYASSHWRPPMCLCGPSAGASLQVAYDGYERDAT